MPVPSAITDLSTTAASNSPGGSENVFPDLDNYIRALSSFVAQIREGSATLLALTVSGNTTLGDASTDTLNVGNGGIVKDASGNVGFGQTANNNANARTLSVLGGTAGGIVELHNSTSGSGASAGLVFQSFNTGANIWNYDNTFLRFATNNTERLRITAAGVIQDGAGLELGFRGLPVASVTTGAFTAADRGKCVFATGNVTVPNSTMSSTDTVTIINTTSSAITITASITTLRLAGTTSTGDRTLDAHGVATVFFSGGTTAYISGAGLS